MATFSCDMAAMPAQAEGLSRSTSHLHATSPTLPTGLATNDVINVGYLPPNAVVTGVTLKALSQLDSSTGLLFDVGITGTATLWMASIATVGRASGVTGVNIITTAGMLYKTTAKTLVIVTVHTQATTAVAGKIEVDVAYFIEETAGVSG